MKTRISGKLCIQPERQRLCRIKRQSLLADSVEQQVPSDCKPGL